MKISGKHEVIKEFFSTFDRKVDPGMKFTAALISKLKPAYFWDVDLTGLDDHSASRLIIERVFSLGSMHEMNQVISFYGEKKVAEVLCRLSFIDAKSYNFIKKLFNLSDKDFKCHNQKQLKPQLWSL